MAEPSNEAVFSPSTLMLGEIHWHILRASRLMYEKTVVETRHGESGLIVQQGVTEFGKDVGRDEIDWWVFRKEHDLQELRERTSRTLNAAQQLKKASDLLDRGERPETYGELLQILRRFAEEHAAEIITLRDYVLWLASRDVLAPKILFTYRVWGSTRMGDREPRFDPGEKPTKDTIERVTEIVLGLASSSGTPTLFRAEYEIGAEMWERVHDEESANFTIATSRIVKRASAMVFEECAEYFEFIRESLRDIIFDIDKFIEQRDFVNDDAFWRAFIVKVSQTPKVELLLWDCKETLTMWHVKKEPERNQAKVTFCEDVANFANARGGVLIIGVTDHREIVGIRELESKLKFAADVLAKHLEYPREMWRLRQIVVPGKDGADKVCVVVVIAQACEPVGVNDGAGRYTYPVRRETGLTRVARDEILNPKIHIKSDNYDFLHEIYQFVHEKQGTN
jgi:hypothetical protein